MTQWQHARSYIELAFSIQKYIPDYVDAYFGPQEIKDRIKKQKKSDLKDLSIKAETIIKSTQQDNTLSEERREYLLAQLTGMQTTLEILQGKQLGIIEEAKRYFGLVPSWTDESEFEKIHRALDDLLPGSGTLYERCESFQDKIIIPKNKIELLIKHISSELRRLTNEFIPLPETENCVYKFVKDKPWQAYNWYLGDYQSRIELNTDLPTQLLLLPWFIAHEAYPGHHTDNVIKEKFLYQEKGYLENSILIYNTPDNVIAEGIGENALEVVASPQEIINLYQFILDEVELDEFDGKLIYNIMTTEVDLRAININLVLMIYEHKTSDQKVIDYQVKYGLDTIERATKFLEFLTKTRSYACLYPMGRKVVKDYISAGENKKVRFLKLLKEQLTPSQLITDIN